MNLTPPAEMPDTERIQWIRGLSAQPLAAWIDTQPIAVRNAEWAVTEAIRDAASEQEVRRLERHRHAEHQLDWELNHEQDRRRGR